MLGDTILTHQDAESHHSQEALQENPKGVHQGTILATPVISARGGAGGHRRVGESHHR